MRKFLVLEEKRSLEKTIKLTIKGLVESDNFPCYDEETAVKKFGTKSPKIIEVTEKCHIELL